MAGHEKQEVVDLLLGAVLQAVGDAGQGGHDPRIVRDLPVLLRHVEVAPETSESGDGRKKQN